MCILAVIHIYGCSKIDLDVAEALKLILKDWPAIQSTYYYRPTGPFTILEPHPLEILEYYVVHELRTTDFELRRGSVGHYSHNFVFHSLHR